MGLQYSKEKASKKLDSANRVNVTPLVPICRYVIYLSR